MFAVSVEHPGSGVSYANDFHHCVEYVCQENGYSCGMVAHALLVVNKSEGASSYMQVEGLPVDALTYRKALGHFASGIAIITTAHDGVVYGATTNTLCAVSLHPPLVLVCVAIQSQMHTLLATKDFYSVSVLSRKQEILARHFAGRPQEDFSPSFIWQHDSPLLEEALVHLVCKITSRYEAGDHMLYIGQVEYLNYSDEHAPLLFYSGRYQASEEQSPQYPVYMYDSALW